MTNLSNKKVAILSTHGFEEVELTSPKAVLEEAGAEVHIIAPQPGSIRSWKEKDWGMEIPVNKALQDADASDYDALVLPGGVMNPDKLRMEKSAVDFVSRFFEQGKPIAAICHGPQVLIETGMIKGRELTSYPSLKTDLENAGASWVDRPVVVDQGLVTSRTPSDLPAFNKKMLEEIAEGVHNSAGV